MRLSYQKFKESVPLRRNNKCAIAILILLNTFGKVIAELTCHQCDGINCSRSNYNTTQRCIDNLDICVSIFDSHTVVAQGCLQQISEELRNKCTTGIETNNPVSGEILSECFKCNENLCNRLGSESFECIQCDSKSDDNCRSKPESLKPTRCLAPQTTNEYCFVKHEGESVIRGCTYSLEEQITCLSSENCTMCLPSEIADCNAVPSVVNGDETGSSGNESDSTGSESGGSNGIESTAGGTSGTDSNGSGTTADGDNSGGTEGEKGSTSSEGSSSKPNENSSESSANEGIGTGSEGGNGSTSSEGSSSKPNENSSDSSANEGIGTGSEGGNGSTSSESSSSKPNDAGDDDDNAGNSDSSNESNNNNNNSSQGDSSESGEVSKGSTMTIAIPYIYILSLMSLLCNCNVFIRN